MELHTSGEDYLEAILVLRKTKNEVRSIDLAEHLGVSRSSVSRAVGLLKEGGFLKDGDGSLEFTQAGLETAQRIYERHCFFKKQLIQAGVDEKTAEEEACRMEHALSQGSFDKIRANIGKEPK